MKTYELYMRVGRILQPLHDISTTGDVCNWIDVANARDEVRAALEAALSAAEPSVAVKDLEWVAMTSAREDGPAEPTGDWEASCMLGEYSVCFDPDQDMSEAPWCVWSPNENIGHYPGIDEAKAAAQADYETRIRSALTAQVQAARVQAAAKTPIDNRHKFQPNKKYPWFCAICGYAPHEKLAHPPEAPAKQEVAHVTD